MKSVPVLPMSWIMLEFIKIVPPAVKDPMVSEDWSKVMPPLAAMAPAAVTAPPDVTVKLVKLIRLVPAVVPLIKSSQPVPMLIAAEVKLPESVTLAMFNPLTLQVAVVQAVNVGLTDRALIVLVAAPAVMLIVGETNSPLVVEAKAPEVVSLNVRLARLPVLAASWT